MDPPLEITTDSVRTWAGGNSPEELIETTIFQFGDNDDINKLSAFLYFDQCHDFSKKKKTSVGIREDIREELKPANYTDDISSETPAKDKIREMNKADSIMTLGEEYDQSHLLEEFQWGRYKLDYFTLFCDLITLYFYRSRQILVNPGICGWSDKYFKRGLDYIISKSRQGTILGLPEVHKNKIFCPFTNWNRLPIQTKCFTAKERYTKDRSNENDNIFTFTNQNLARAPRPPPYMKLYADAGGNPWGARALAELHVLNICKLQKNAASQWDSATRTITQDSTNQCENAGRLTPEQIPFALSNIDDNWLYNHFNKKQKFIIKNSHGTHKFEFTYSYELETDILPGKIDEGDQVFLSVNEDLVEERRNGRPVLNQRPKVYRYNINDGPVGLTAGKWVPEIAPDQQEKDEEWLVEIEIIGGRKDKSDDRTLAYKYITPDWYGYKTGGKSQYITAKVWSYTKDKEEIKEKIQEEIQNQHTHANNAFLQSLLGTTKPLKTIDQLRKIIQGANYDNFQDEGVEYIYNVINRMLSEITNADCLYQWVPKVQLTKFFGQNFPTQPVNCPSIEDVVSFAVQNRGDKPNIKKKMCLKTIGDFGQVLSCLRDSIIDKDINRAKHPGILHMFYSGDEIPTRIGAWMASLNEHTRENTIWFQAIKASGSDKIHMPEEMYNWIHNNARQNSQTGPKMTTTDYLHHIFNSTGVEVKSPEIQEKIYDTRSNKRRRLRWGEPILRMKLVEPLLKFGDRLVHSRETKSLHKNFKASPDPRHEFVTFAIDTVPNKTLITLINGRSCPKKVSKPKAAYMKHFFPRLAPAR